MSRREMRMGLVVCLLALLLPLADTVAGLGTGFIYLGPAMVLLFPLLLGRYVGERRLVSFHRPLCPTHCRSIRAARPRIVFERLLVRGGLLIAASLAVRPPPALRTR
jgi:hypothetical protein